MKNHYEELGIPPTASDTEIKRAYRKRANETHPDKGGSDEEFAKVSNAYEVLKDPERKLLYDATGQDNREPIEVAIQNGLLHAFNAAIQLPDDVEIIARIRLGFRNILDTIADAERKGKSLKKKLLAKRSKVKTTDTVNVFHLIIDQELLRIDAHLEDLKYQEKVNKGCLKALKTYSEEFKAPEPTLQDLLRRDGYFAGVKIEYGR